jgi:hypothetical protein
MAKKVWYYWNEWKLYQSGAVLNQSQNSALVSIVPTTGASAGKRISVPGSKVDFNALGLKNKLNASAEYFKRSGPIGPKFFAISEDTAGGDTSFVWVGQGSTKYNQQTRGWATLAEKAQQAVKPDVKPEVKKAGMGLWGALALGAGLLWLRRKKS